MNTLNAIQTCFPPNRGHLSINRPKKLSTRKLHTIQFCSAGSNGSDLDPPPSSSDENKRRQELLAKIAMIQAQKMRLTDFLDERSAYLTQFAEEANTEFDQIEENALKELDDATSRILENLETRMQSFEESAAINRQKIERSEKELEEFEDRIERDRNEGLFFRNLTDSKRPKNKTEIKAEAQKIIEVTRRNTGSETRKSIFLALMAVLVIVIANSLFSFPEVEWRRLAAFALIFFAVFTQYVYELNLSQESTGKKDDKE